MASHAYSTITYPDADPSLRSELSGFDLRELLGLYDILRSGANAVRASFAQPRVTQAAEDLLDRLVEPLESMTDAIVCEARSRSASPGAEAEYRAQIVLGYLVEGGDLREVAAEAVALLGAQSAH